MTRAVLTFAFLVLIAGCSRQPVTDCPDLRKVQAKPLSVTPRQEPGSALSRLRIPWRQAAPVAAPVPARPPAKATPVAKPEPKAKPKKVERKTEPEPRPKKKKRKQRDARETVQHQVQRRAAEPDLPWSCWQVRLAAGGRSRSELEAMGRQRGIALTKKQIKQAQACLNGR